MKQLICTLAFLMGCIYSCWARQGKENILSLDSLSNVVVEYCLIQDDLDSLLSYFNHDEEKAIMSLCSYEMDAQLGAYNFWFSFGNISSGCLMSFKYNSDTLYCTGYGESVYIRGESLKLKSAYWIIVLFYKLDYVNGTICEFYEKHKKLSDISMIITYGKKDVVFEMSPTAIEGKIKKWQKKLNKYGLEYLRLKDLFFLKLNEYKVQKESHGICRNHLIYYYNGTHPFQSCYPFPNFPKK